MNKPPSKLSVFQEVIRCDGFGALSKCAKAVLKDLWTVVCVNRADDGAYTTHASNAYIGQWSGWSARAVSQALGELRAAGFVEVRSAESALRTVRVLPVPEQVDLAGGAMGGSTVCAVTAHGVLGGAQTVLGGVAHGARGVAGERTCIKEEQTTEQTKEQTSGQSVRARGDGISDEQIVRLCRVYPKHTGRGSIGHELVAAVKAIASERVCTERDAAEWLIARASLHWAEIARRIPVNPAAHPKPPELRWWLRDRTYEVEPEVAFSRLADAPKPVSFEDAAKAERLSMVDRGVAIARERREARERRAAQ